MKPFYFRIRYLVIACCVLILNATNSYAQRNYAATNRVGNSGILCIGCSVTNSNNAADGNLQSFSTLNVIAGVGAQTWEEIIFPAGSGVAANIPVTVKLGTGNNLIDLTLLGGIYLQAYNGNTAIGSRVAASTLVSALSGNNQIEVSFTPAQIFDRVRVTLDGGTLGVASSIYLYDAFYGLGSGCNTAFDELHGISSALLGLGLSVGGVVNPQLAIDGDLNTASTLNAGVGLAGAYAQQTVIFQTPSNLGDSVRLTIALPQTLLTAGVLANISASTFNGNTSNNDTQTFNSSLLSVRLLDLGGGISKAVIAFAPAAVFDRVQLRLGGGVANALSTLNFYEAQIIIPAPVVKYNNTITSNLQLCAGSSATLVTNTAPNTTFSWYTQATGGTAVATGSSFTTPALTATTTYYAAAAHPGCVTESARTPVIITVNPIPAAPVVANNNVTVCPGQQATFVATPVTGVTFNWYTSTTGGTPVGNGTSFTTGALTATTNYYAEAVSGGTCISPTRTQVTAVVSPLPATPALTVTNVTICDGDIAILSIASPVAGITYNWYATNTGGTILYTGINFTTPSLHTTTNYYAEAVNGNSCSSGQRVTGTVTVVPKPSDPVLTTSNSTVIAGQTASIAVSNAQTGVTYNWYTTSTIATPVFTGTTYQTPALYSTTTYYVSGVNTTSCTSVNRVPVTINVTINNNSPCTFANTQTNNVSGGVCVLCAVNNPALATDADTTTASTLNITAGLVGAYAEQQLVFQQPGFAGDTIKIGLQSPVSLASAGVAGSIQVTLYNGTTQVSQYTLDNNLIKVNLLSGGNNRYNVYIPATGAYDRVTIRLTSGVATLLSTLQIYYALQQYPKPTFTPANPEICSGSTAQVNITSPATGTYSFYNTPTGGSPLYTGTSFTTPALTANTAYYIEYNRNGCISPVRYPVMILINSAPANATVTPLTATIYSGQTATFNAATLNNATVNWYTSATGGTSVFTGNTFTTPALSANTDYYAETSLGTCVSPGRTHVNVVVNPVIIPDVAVNPATQTVNAGTVATLTASSTTPGTVFNWYTQPTGGTSIYTGPTLTTPALFANTTYYAEATVTATGAVSATRASGVVNVNTLATNPTPCDAAIDQTTANSGVLCVNCIVNNPTGSVDADRNTFSQLNVLAGVLNAYTQQTLRFANTGHAGDSVIVELGIPGSLASVGVLSQISLATYNGTTYNNDRFNVNGSLINVSLLNGTSKFRVAFAPTADFDRVEIRLNSSLAGVLNSLNVYDASEAVAPPVVTASTVNVCQGSQATLTATAPGYVTVKWYTTATGGAPVFTGSVFNTPALTANTTYYAEASRTADGCAQTIRTPVNVTVTPIPAAPVINTPTVTICAGQPAVFIATPVSGVIYNWYSAATGGTPLFTGNTFTTGALAATTSYYVEAGNGSCTNSARTQVTANVNTAINDPSVAQTSVSTCSGTSAVLTATSTQPGISFNWYAAATGGTPIFTGAQFTTPTLTANTIYYVEASSGTCTSPDRIAVNVTVNPAPAAPTLTTVPVSGQITSGQTASITATSTTAGASFNWYTSATGGTPIFTGSTFTTPALTSTATYYAESALTTGCLSTRTPVTITVNPVFSTTCDFASNQTTDVNGGVICAGCTVSNPNNSVDADLTNYSTLNIVAGVAGSYVSQSLIFSETGSVGDTVSVLLHFPVSIVSAGVLDRVRIGSFNGTTYNNDGIFLNNSSVKVQILSGGQTAIVRFAPQAVFDRVEVRITSAVVSAFNSLDIGYASKQVEAPQLAASTANICAGTTATFTVSNARAGVTYDWFSTAVGGTLLYTGTTFTTPSLSTTTTYYVQSSRTSNTCPNPNRVSVTANVTSAPVTPILAQSNMQLCAGDNAILVVTNAGTATVNWYDAATGGNLIFTGANFQVTPLASTNYYAELTNGTCTSPTRVQATVTVNPRPAKPGVPLANVTVCTGGTAALQVLNPEANVTYDWYNAVTGGNIVFTGTSFTTPAIMQNTSYYIQATSTTGGCTNNGGRTQVNVNTNGVIANPVLSATQTQVCNGGSASISVQNPVNGLTYNWYTAATGGTLAFTGTTFTLNNLTANTSYFVEADNSTGCASAGRTETDITVLPIPVAPTIQPIAGSGVCQGASATLNIANPQAGQVYNWYTAATGGTLLYTGTQFNTPSLTSNTTYYAEAVAAGNCNPSARTAITINVNSLPADPVLASARVNVCAGNAATFTIASPQTGVSYNWYDSASLTTLLYTGAQFTTPALTANASYYVAAINASGCQSNNLAVAQAAVQAVPGLPTIANGSTIPDCSGSAVTLTISNPAVGITYNWYSAATGGTLVSTGTSFTTAALTANVTYYAEAVNTAGCVSSSRTPVTISVNQLPATPVIANGSTVQDCSGSAVTLNISNPVTGTTYNWYTSATGGTPVATGASFTTAGLTTATSYYAEAVNTTGCTSTTRTPVTINISTTPASPVIANGSTVQDCSGSAVTLNISNPVAGVTYNWYNAANGGTLVSTGTSFTTGALTSDVTYYAEAVNSIGCVSANRTAVTVNVSQPLPAPTVTVQGASGTPTVCAGSSTTLNATSTASNVKFNWYSQPTGGSILFTGATFTTGPLSANVTYYAEAASSSSTCVSAARTAVSIVVLPLPATPVPVAANVNTCMGNPATLAVSSPGMGITYNWYDSAAMTNLLHTGSTYTTGPLTDNANYYIGASNGTCSSSALATVQVVVNQLPSSPLVVNSSVTSCANSTVILSISNPQTGFIYNWYSAASGGTPLFTGTSFTTPQITASTTYYAEAVNSTGCPSAARTAVNVIPAAAPAAPAVNAPGNNVCAGGSIILSVTIPDPKLTINWYATAAGGAALATGNSFITPALTANVTYYAEATSTTGGCTSVTRTAVPIAVKQSLSAPIVTVQSTTASSITFQWNPVSGAAGYQVSVDKGVTFITPSSGATGTTHTVTGLNVNQTVGITVKALGSSGCQLSINSASVIGTSANPLGDEIFVPNAFTPNGDGNNDILYVYGASIKSLRFMVYDQYGELLLRSLSQATGWDGTYKGVREPVGVYVYMLQATMADGSIVNKKGSITLLR